jgi:hypothetical protein
MRGKVSPSKKIEERARTSGRGKGSERGRSKLSWDGVAKLSAKGVGKLRAENENRETSKEAEGKLLQKRRGGSGQS